MARAPDKPGTFRIVPKRGAWMLSGLRKDGTRVKVPGLERNEAEEMGRRLFNVTYTNDATGTISSDVPLPPLVDDYGLPPLKASPSVVQSTAPIVPPLPTSLMVKPDAVVPPEDAAKKEQRTKNAKSLMELAGVSWAAGTVWVGRKLTERAGCEPVTPNTKQVNDLRDTTKDTLIDMFGDKEVKPWQMMCLLTIGIILSMLIQSPKKPKAKEGEAKKEESPNLRSV